MLSPQFFKTMNRYYVDYTDDCGDLTHVWVEADSADQAADEVMDEYWDIKEIISIRRR